MRTGLMRAAFVSAMVLIGVGCSSSNESDTASTEGVDVAQEEGATSATTENPATEDPATDTTEPAAAPAVVEPLLTGADGIAPLTPVQVDALRPVLAWEPVDQAASYTVVVLDEADAPYWVWIGPEAEVPVGGAEASDFCLLYTSPSPRD